MLTNETMGIVALAILWVNVLLIAASTAKQLAAILARRAALGDVVRGSVARGEGPGGAIAAHRIEQLGRAADEGTILFHDRAAATEVFGGAVAAFEGRELTVAAGATAEVWLAPEILQRAAACASDDAFDEAHASARKAKGFARTVIAPLGEGAVVFVSHRADGVLLATMDPRGLLTKKAALATTFIVAELLAAAGCTALALWPPLFGALSTLGGALCLAFFLLVQPAGTAIRDALLVPSLAPVRGRWARATAPEQARTMAGQAHTGG